MASRGGSDGRASGLGGGASPPRLPAAPRRSGERKLARFANQGERSSSGQSSRAPRLPVAASSEEDDLVPARSPTFSAGDYVHVSDEEEAVMAQTFAISAAEARARFRWEEADTVR
ncbi:hypothetical protein QYE76_052129 [Lolium multiflorum]|uniref:Uncharacterized protein n=1 Tax=Lolium multiflorum TaxID=4521 RepID=A0AAD8WL88_LOLMU|nr:hypothetical protein QYE76_052129 [Lolium multiflorum]